MPNTAPRELASAWATSSTARGSARDPALSRIGLEEHQRERAGQREIEVAAEGLGWANVPKTRKLAPAGPRLPCASTHCAQPSSASTTPARMMHQTTSRTCRQCAHEAPGEAEQHEHLAPLDDLFERGGAVGGDGERERDDGQVGHQRQNDDARRAIAPPARNYRARQSTPSIAASSVPRRTNAMRSAQDAVRAATSTSVGPTFTPWTESASSEPKRHGERHQAQRGQRRDECQKEYAAERAPPRRSQRRQPSKAAASRRHRQRQAPACRLPTNRWKPAQRSSELSDVH